MVQVMNNYSNDYKPMTFINGQPHSTPPPPPLQAQQMPIPMPVPMIMPTNFFPPPPPQAMYPAEQAGMMDYGGYPIGFVPPGYFPDITVYVPTLQKHYALNSNILSRSPVLYQRIREEQSNTLELDLYVLPETFHTIIGHLSRPLTPQEIMFLASEKPQIAIELLEACEELGLEPLMDALMVALNQRLNQKTAMTYIEAMEPYQALEDEEPRRWVEVLEDHIIAYMVKGLSRQLEAFSTTVKVSGNVVIGQVNATGYMSSRTPPMRGWMDLARAYASLPKHLMIRCLEHPGLPVQDAIQRSYFAKRVLSIVNSNNHFHQRQDPELTAIMRFEHGFDSIAVVKQTERKKGCWNPELYNVY